jgi:HD-GYP domain-containing protein (c-di-GMP phosphodiesterase class II)
MKKSKILLISKNDKLMDLICFSLQTNFRFEVERLNSILSVIEYFQENKDFSLVISDFAIGEKEFSNTLKTFIDSKSDIPYIALGASKKFKEHGDDRSHVTEFIGKKNLLEDLNTAITKYFTINKDEKPKEYCEVSFSILTAFEGLETDLFIQLSSGRYLKIYQTHDQITEDDVNKYKEKGVKDLWLHKKVSTWLLKTLNKNIEEVLDAIENFEEIKIPVEPPMPQVEDSEDVEVAKNEEEVFEKIEDKIDKIEEVFNFDEKMQKDVNEKIQATLESVKKVPTLSKLLKKLDVNRADDNYVKEHVTLLCKICTALCHLMEWRQSATIEKLVFVSYLHDITLINHPKLARLQNKEDIENFSIPLSDKEKKMFLGHPQAAKDLVDKMPEAPADAANIILQHHENCNGTGFPNGHSANRLLPLSSLFIVAHDLVHYIFEDPNWDMASFIEQTKDKYSGSNFNKIVRKLDKLKI